MCHTHVNFTNLYVCLGPAGSCVPVCAKRTIIIRSIVYDTQVYIPLFYIFDPFRHSEKVSYEKLISYARQHKNSMFHADVDVDVDPRIAANGGISPSSRRLGRMHKLS